LIEPSAILFDHMSTIDDVRLIPILEFPFSELDEKQRHSEAQDRKLRKVRAKPVAI
jgi:hypothetical protein